MEGSSDSTINGRRLNSPLSVCYDFHARHNQYDKKNRGVLRLLRHLSYESSSPLLPGLTSILPPPSRNSTTATNASPSGVQTPIPLVDNSCLPPRGRRCRPLHLLPAPNTALAIASVSFRFPRPTASLSCLSPAPVAIDPSNAGTSAQQHLSK